MTNQQNSFISGGEPPIRPTLVLILCAAVAFALMMFALSCGEKDPLPTTEEKMQGAWHWEFGTVEKRWNFHQGACDEYVCIIAQPVQLYTYATEFRGDTLRMLDLACGDAFEYEVFFPTDSTAGLRPIPYGVGLILTRI